MENIVTGPCRAHSQEALKQALEFVSRMLKGYRRLCVKTSAYCKPLWVVSCTIGCTTAAEQEHFVPHCGLRSEHKLLNPNKRAVEQAIFAKPL